MNLRTYQAYTMAEALAAVKRDLGAHAVILNTRTFRRGGLFGLGRRTVVEVTATAGKSGHRERSEGLPARRPGSKQAPRPPRTALAAYAGAAKPRPSGEPADDEPTVGESDRIRTRRLAQAILERYERQQRESGPASMPRDEEGREARAEDASPETAQSTSYPQSDARVVNEVAEPVEASTTTMANAERVTSTEPVARRFILRPAQSTGDADAVDSIGSPGCSTPGPNPARLIGSARATRGSRGSPASASQVPDSGGGIAVLDPPSPAAVSIESHPVSGSHLMHDELAAIRTMVGEVLRRQVRTTGAPAPTMPPRLFDMYLELVGQDVSDELADRIVNDVRDELTTDALEDEEMVRDAVLERLTTYIPVADEPIPSCSPDRRPLTIALIGPTGVGKTTTLAKLAASFKLRHHKKVGLVTADTYRIAAVDQLRTYANIIGLPLQVVLTSNEMRQAVRSLADRDVILIDTAGRSQNDASRLGELKQFLHAAEPHEVHLVLSSTAGEKVLLREAEAFSDVGVDKVVLTKLDEAVSFGTLINVVHGIGKQLSFFTTGQEVPDHIEVGRPERLAELVMGGAIRA